MRDVHISGKVFEKNWIFAYEIYDGGVIVRDMAHATTLAE